MSVPASPHAPLRSPAETVLRAYDAWNAGDLPSLLALCDPDAEAEGYLAAVVGRPSYHGHDGVAALFDDAHRVWQRYRIELVRMRCFRDDVVALVDIHVENGTGTTLEGRVCHRFRVHDGRIVELRVDREIGNTGVATGVVAAA